MAGFLLLSNYFLISGLISAFFQGNPQVFATVQHQYSDRPFDAMNIWVEEISNSGFVVCLRELMTFDGVHSGLQVVSFRVLTATKANKTERFIRSTALLDTKPTHLLNARSHCLVPVCPSPTTAVHSCSYNRCTLQ